VQSHKHFKEYGRDKYIETGKAVFFGGAGNVQDAYSTGWLG